MAKNGSRDSNSKVCVVFILNCVMRSIPFCVDIIRISPTFDASKAYYSYYAINVSAII